LADRGGLKETGREGILKRRDIALAIMRKLEKAKSC